jgi:hypothetical protein
MNVRHISITASADIDGSETGVVGGVISTVIKDANRRPNGKFKIKTMLISNVEGSNVSVSVGLRFPFNQKKDDRSQATIGTKLDTEKLSTDTAFYLVKGISIPKFVALNLTEGFPDGIPYSSNYELFVTLGTVGHKINIILEHE